MTEEDKIYLLALSNIKGLSNRNLNTLLIEYLTPKQLYNDFPFYKIKSIKKKNEIEYQLKSNDKIAFAKNVGEQPD